MKLLVTADLHYGTSRADNRQVEALAQRVCQEQADALLIAGDIGEGLPAISACLSLFRPFTGMKLAVPGNHDIWVHAGAADSWDLHERALPQLFESHGFHPLHVRSTRIADVGFVGSMGWYDYSFRDDIGIDLERYESKIYPGSPGPLWNDARYVRLPMSDVELTACLAQRLRDQLQSVDDCRSIVAVVHHLVSKRLLFHPRFMVPRVWRFLNAFLGSTVLGTVLTEQPRVRLALCGHIHRARSVRQGRACWSTVGRDHDARELVYATPEAIVRRERFPAE